jgi:hypothetical protein
MTRAESASTTMSRRGSALGDADCTPVWVRGDQDIATRVSLAAVGEPAAAVEANRGGP